MSNRITSYNVCYTKLLRAGEVLDPLEDGIAVAVPLGQDGEDQGGGRGGDQVLVDLHALPRAYLAVLYIAPLGM